MTAVNPDLPVADLEHYAHYQKYEALAQKLGVERLKPLVMRATGLCCHADPVALLKERFSHDEHLNNIPLRQWDRLDYAVRELVRRTGGGVWSVSDTVCVLKHVARHHVIGAEVPPVAEDPREK